MRSSFEEYAEQVGPKIEAALERAVEGVAGCPEILREAMHYALLSPGKRLRPLLVLLAADTCGTTENDQAVPPACAVEMVHAYSLVHDDLPAMDNDELRRGRPTCHKVFGDALAILAGDALLTLAFETLAHGIHPPERAAVCCAVLAEAAGRAGLVGGQVDDLLAQQHPSLPSKVFHNFPPVHSGQTSKNPPHPRSEDQKVAKVGNTPHGLSHSEFSGGETDRASSDASSDLTYLESIHRRKTGAMILASLRLGALSADASQAEQTMLVNYGQALGLAFQIVDDLLDVRGDESTVGKRLHKDSAQGKLTFPALLGVEESLRRAESLVQEAIQAVAPMGSRANRLQALAHYVLQRSR